MNRVIVIDDSKVIRNAASKMLGSEFDVVTAEDGSDGWILIEQDPLIQVVFTDLVMPGVNGYELLRNVRTSADARIRGLPVIVVTGIEDDEVARVRALELGATDFITKPFTTIDLLARARAHASHQRETSELRAQTTLDALTGLANKAGFLDRMQQDMAYARRHQQQLTLVRIEIDEFRSIFLQRGKDVSERLLCQVAKLLRATIRKEDTAGRIALGGFALSLPAGDPQGVERMVQRLRAEIAKEWPAIVGDSFPVRLSAVVFRPPIETGLSAHEALDQSQSKLTPLIDSASMPAVAVPTTTTTATTPSTPTVATPAAPAPTVAPSVQAPVTPLPTVRAATANTPSAASAPPTAHAPLRIDPLLEQIDRGNPHPAIAGMPLILRRLLPLLRLLTPAQRDSLMRFLQQPPSQ
jgi:diguanylate cyclase (GGDEF)-like protein